MTQALKLVFLLTMTGLALGAPASVEQDLPLIGVNLKNKIVGGAEVEPNSLPFQISLQWSQSDGSFVHICGGSVLDNTTILTAAHCVAGTSPNRLQIVAGAHSFNPKFIPALVETTRQTSAVTSVIIHEDYDSDTYTNDIALLLLKEPLNTDEPVVKPIILPQPTSDFDPPAGTTVTVSGWGNTAEDGSLSFVLISVDLPIISDEECNAAYAIAENPTPIVESMICAVNLDGGKDACRGDSGGPLFTGTGVDAVQHGIVSWGKGCARPGYPGVYTQVSYFLNWIAANRPSTN